MRWSLFDEIVRMSWDTLRNNKMRSALTVLGVVIGIMGAAAITRIIGTLLYDVTPTDPISFAAVVGVLGGVGLLASYLPARRAMRINPVAALRSE